MEKTNITLPTRGKSKISQGWSYPLGAELISNALRSIPQYENIYLRFLWMHHSTFSKNKAGLVIPILGVSYSNPFLTMLKENWRIDVHAVDSNLRLRVKDYLINQGLPDAKIWMTKKRPDLWYESGKHIGIYFYTVNEQFIFKESGGT